MKPSLPLVPRILPVFRYTAIPPFVAPSARSGRTSQTDFAPSWSRPHVSQSLANGPVGGPAGWDTWWSYPSAIKPTACASTTSYMALGRAPSAQDTPLHGHQSPPPAPTIQWNDHLSMI
ncbi:hypothetical protein IAU60_004436 [Kwoniella sp. DSM 27419]